VKELKELDVAGSATVKATEKDFFLQWHLTERCNLACRHCYQSGVESGEMDVRAIRETADEVADMLKDWAQRYDIVFAPSLNITGGEPLLRKDLFEILSLVGQYGFERYLLTNGTLINRDKAKRLKSLVDGVQVSMEGPEALHDSIRGKGSFKRAASGVEALVSQGIPVSLNATISRLNAHSLSFLVELGRDLGVKKIGFSRLVPRGKGAELKMQMLTPDEVRHIYLSLLALADDTIEVDSGDPLAALMGTHPNGDGGDTPYGGCAAGVSGLTLLADGTVTPCRRLPIPLGNVTRDSLRHIWTGSRVLNLLRDRSAYKGDCGRCRHWARCRGCRAIAFACGHGGRAAFLDDDPQCFAADIRR
jgi:radical SAM protein with 4Fe4S-binding SPASM domain